MPTIKDEEKVEQILDTPDLADALESDRFKQFLDQVPVAIAVSELKPRERIIYANLEFERLSGIAAADLDGKSWAVLDWQGDKSELSKGILTAQDHIGSFVLEKTDTPVNVWANLIENDDGIAVFRLVALAPIPAEDNTERAALIEQIENKDVLLRELQHRVKNNLQMITALIRLEARNMPEQGPRLDQLAGRVEALALLYQSLSEENKTEEIDLGIYLSQIAGAVMRAHGREGVRLDLKVDTWPVSINVAMPTGLVVNEVMTNSLKHAFNDRDGGTISAFIASSTTADAALASPMTAPAFRTDLSGRNVAS